MDTKTGKAFVCEYGGGQLAHLFVASDSTSPASYLTGAALAKLLADRH